MASSGRLRMRSGCTSCTASSGGTACARIRPPAHRKGSKLMVSSPAPTVMLHLRLWRQFALTNAMLLTEYRASFAFGVARQIASLGLTVFGFGLLYQYT